MHFSRVWKFKLQWFSYSVLVMTWILNDVIFFVRWWYQYNKCVWSVIGRSFWTFLFIDFLFSRHYLEMINGLEYITCTALSFLLITSRLGSLWWTCTLLSIPMLSVMRHLGFANIVCVFCCAYFREVCVKLWTTGTLCRYFSGWKFTHCFDSL